MAEPILAAAPVAVAKCPSCDLASVDVVWKESGYAAKRCICGNLFIDPPPVLDNRELSYDGHFRTYYSRPANVRLDWVSRFRPLGSLLEVGCGPGDFLHLARARGYSVAGIDPNPACVDHARRLGIEVECAYIEQAAPPAEKFDVVYHVDLLIHFPDPLLALRAMAARLKPTGILCFEVGILGGIAPAWYRYMGGVGFPQHRFLYSKRGVLRLLKRAGFDAFAVRQFGLGASLALTAVRHLYGSGVRERIHRRHALGRFRHAEPHLPPDPQGLVWLYDWLTYVLRYRLGPAVPRWGPLTMFVAARSAKRGPSDARLRPRCIP